MAASAYTNYGTGTPSAISRGYSSFMGTGSTGPLGGSDYESSPLRYNPRLLNMRRKGDQTNISTISDLSPAERLMQQANKIYEGQAAAQEAQRMAARDVWNDQIDYLNTADVGRDFAGSIYEGGANYGFNPGLGRDERYAFRPAVQSGPQAAANAYNREAFAGANNAMLRQIGINPSQVSRAYENFKARNFY